MYFRWELLFLSICISYDGCSLVESIKLNKVWIPQFAVKDGSIILGCDFNMEKDKLLVLKWYKDTHEFFRFTPNQLSSLQPVLTFPVDGVYVNKNKSGMSRIVLENITLATEGVYKCEVSADSPSFRTLHDSRKMTVIAQPANPPEIEVVNKGPIKPGERLEANCTSRRSRPAAVLSYSINEEYVESSDLIKYDVIVHPDGLESVILGLATYLEARHFEPHTGMLELRCTATIGNGYWISKKLLSQDKIKAQLSVAGHDSLHSAATPYFWGIFNPIGFVNLIFLTFLFQTQTAYFLFSWENF